MWVESILEKRPFWRKSEFSEMNSYHVIKGCKDSCNSTLVRAPNAARRLPPHAVVSGLSTEAFKQRLADEGTAVLALSYAAAPEQRFTKHCSPGQGKEDRGVKFSSEKWN